jgi:hypothetical protein
MSLCIFEKNESGDWQCLVCSQIVPKKAVAKPRAMCGYTPSHTSSDGPGTHLSRLIARFQRLLPWWDMQPHSGCGCNDTARWMDQLGPDGCEEQIDQIVDRLEAEATKREIKFPFRRAAAKRTVRWAIRRARKAE